MTNDETTIMIYPFHKELQEAIDKTLLAYGNYQSDRMRELTFKHLTNLFETQNMAFQQIIMPTISLIQKDQQ